MANVDALLQGGNDTGTATATIANAASLSDACYLGGARLLAIQMPAAWTTATTISLQASADGITYCEMTDDTGTALAITGVAVSLYMAITNPALYAGAQYIKLRSGTSGSAVTQGASRAITLVVQRL